jgi:hypothetical protein
MNTELEAVWKVLRVPVDQPSVPLGAQPQMVIEEELPEFKKAHYYYELAKPDLYEKKPPNPNYYHPVEYRKGDSQSILFFVPEK